MPVYGMMEKITETTLQGLEFRVQGDSPPYVDRIWGMWGSYGNVRKTIFYILEVDFKLQQNPQSFNPYKQKQPTV